MSSDYVAQTYRRFLLAVTAFIFIGTAAELLLLEHTGEALQFIPFILSGLGLLSIAWAWFSPGRTALHVLRWVMATVVLASLLGMWLHFSGNLAFTREINPSYTLSESIVPALKGSYPLLAPGILFLAGTLGWAATWRHPALRD